MVARNDIKNLKVRAAVDTLRANIGFAEVDVPIKSIAVVSAMPADGKSTVALALAQSYAAQGARTLLVECDLRRRTAAHRLGIHRPDATVLVVRPNHTERKALAGAYEQLCKAGANVVGTVANGVDDSADYYMRSAESQARRQPAVSGAHAPKAGERPKRFWKTS